jgi:hypothetical protein
MQYRITIPVVKRGLRHDHLDRHRAGAGYVPERSAATPWHQARGEDRVGLAARWPGCSDQPKASFRALHGFLKGKTNGKALTIEEMDDAIAEAGAAAGAGE